MEPKTITLTDVEIDLLVKALEKAASRHETYARTVKYFRKHDDIAARMRALRLRLVKTGQRKIIYPPLTASAPSLSS